MIGKMTFTALFFAFYLSAFAEQPVIRLWPIEMVGPTLINVSVSLWIVH